MEYKVNIRKMSASPGDPIEYRMDSDKGSILLNDWIGREISLFFDGTIHCVICGKKITKTFAQGSCYDCFRNAPENAECIIRPELCRAHLGEGRDPAWEEKHHNRPHYVYLALSSAVKVGVTREDQIPTRWIDQGASEGLILARCPNRYEAGKLEVYLKDFFTDRTNWRRMLKNEVSSQSLSEVKKELIPRITEEFRTFISEDTEPVVMDFPVQEYPEKVKSLNLLKSPVFQGDLKGLKGQYLLFNEGIVWNVRSHSGFEVLIRV